MTDTNGAYMGERECATFPAVVENRNEDVCFKYLVLLLESIGAEERAGRYLPTLPRGFTSNREATVHTSESRAAMQHRYNSSVTTTPAFQAPTFVTYTHTSGQLALS